jgi:hypothetical protein
MFIVKMVGPSVAANGGVNHMNSHVLRLLVGVCLLCLTCSATAVMVRSDDKEIAVAADSKRKDVGAPVCKVRRIDGGVVFAAGNTGYETTEIATGKTEVVYDAYEIGSKAAAGLKSPMAMIEHFSQMIVDGLMKNLAHEVVDKRTPIAKLEAEPFLQVGYALFVEGKPSFAVRSFFPSFIADKGPFRVFGICGPEACSGPYRQGDHAPLGAVGMETEVTADPSLLKLNPLDFVTNLLNQAVIKASSTVGPPLTRLTMSSNNKVDWAEIGACPDQPRKGDSTPQQGTTDPAKK